MRVIYQQVRVSKLVNCRQLIIFLCFFFATESVDISQLEVTCMLFHAMIYYDFKRRITFHEFHEKLNTVFGGCGCVSRANINY